MAKKRNKSKKVRTNPTPRLLRPRQALPRTVLGTFGFTPTLPEKHSRIDALLRPTRRIAVIPPAIKQPSRQKALKIQLRAPTIKALGRPKKATRQQMQEKQTIYRDTICDDYKRSRQQRRQTMFATGGAGKGKRNPGPRQADWRKEFCR
jgi:hypothetical protein